MSETSHDHMATSSQVCAAGTTIEPHLHPWHQVVYPSTGAVAVTTDVGTWITPPNRAIWIPAGVLHHHRFHGRTRFHCVAFEPARYADPARRPTVLLIDPLTRELIKARSSADTDDSPGDRRLLDVLHDHLRFDDPQPQWLPTPTDPRLVEACTLVAENLSTPLRLSAVGAAIGVGERTLSRLFAEDLAMSYREWRTQLRLHHAVRLLADDHTVTDVAHRCGWATPSAFIDTFRRSLGYTPGTSSASRARSGTRTQNGV